MTRECLTMRPMKVLQSVQGKLAMGAWLQHRPHCCTPLQPQWSCKFPDVCSSAPLLGPLASTSFSTRTQPFCPAFVPSTWSNFDFSTALTRHWSSNFGRSVYHHPELLQTLISSFWMILLTFLWGLAAQCPFITLFVTLAQCLSYLKHLRSNFQHVLVNIPCIIDCSPFFSSCANSQKLPLT